MTSSEPWEGEARVQRRGWEVESWEKLRAPACRGAQGEVGTAGSVGVEGTGTLQAWSSPHTVTAHPCHGPGSEAGLPGAEPMTRTHA